MSDSYTPRSLPCDMDRHERCEVECGCICHLIETDPDAIARFKETFPTARGYDIPKRDGQ